MFPVRAQEPSEAGIFASPSSLFALSSPWPASDWHAFIPLIQVAFFIAVRAWIKGYAGGELSDTCGMDSRS